MVHFQALNSPTAPLQAVFFLKIFGTEAQHRVSFMSIPLQLHCLLLRAATMDQSHPGENSLEAFPSKASKVLKEAELLAVPSPGLCRSGSLSALHELKEAFPG